MSTRLQSRLWTELTAAKKFLKMAEIKHQVLIFDQQLCLDSTFGKMILNSLKSCAVIANHFGSLNQTLSSSLSIGVVDIRLEEVTQETNEDGGHLGLEHNIEIRPLISPPIFLSSSTLLEVFAAIDVMMKPKEKVAHKIKEPNQSKAPLEIEWSSMAEALMPHVDFPPQEGYRVIFITRTPIKVNGWVQQPNCLLLQFVHVAELNVDLDEPAFGAGSTMQIKTADGFSQVEIPPLASEWETFFKLHTFEKYLVPSIPLIIHFSTSIYSKLIVTCSARPQCLNIASPVKSSLGMAPDATKCVLETVTRVPKAGICHGLILSQAFVIRPKDATKHDIKENMGNHLRFRAVLKELETPNDYVMILRSSVNPEKSAIRAYFVLVPSLANGYFLLSQIASSELVLPESDLLSKYQNNVDELSMMANVEDDPGNGEMTAQLEMRSALQKIPIQIPTYNVLEFSCGIVRTLENTIQKKSKKTSNSSRPSTASSRSSTTTTSTTRGRGRTSKPRGGRGGSAKYAAVVQTKSNSQKH